MIVEYLKQFRGLLFGYEIEIFSDPKNLSYAATLSKSQHVMHWKLIIEEFEPNIKHKDGVDNIVADTLIRLTYTSVEKYRPSTMKDHFCSNKLFAIRIDKNNEDYVPLYLLNVQIEQQK